MNRFKNRSEDGTVFRVVDKHDSCCKITAFTLQNMQKFVFHSITLSFRKHGKHFPSNGINQFPMQAHTLYTACLICLTELLVVRDEVRISSCSCNAFQFRPAIIALHFRSGSCVKIGSKLSNHNARF